jgi:hypothetical protein
MDPEVAVYIAGSVELKARDKVSEPAIHPFSVTGMESHGSQEQM